MPQLTMYMKPRRSFVSAGITTVSSSYYIRLYVCSFLSLRVQIGEQLRLDVVPEVIKDLYEKCHGENCCQREEIGAIVLYVSPTILWRSWLLPAREKEDVFEFQVAAEEEALAVATQIKLWNFYLTQSHPGSQGQEAIR